MPLEPVRSYDEPDYPTLEDTADGRRAFLRSIGLAAIAAAFGPVAGCDRFGGTIAGVDKNTKNAGPGNKGGPPPDHPRTAGVPPPPKWPGPKAALVGGGPIPVTFAGGDKGWVALAVTFDPNDAALEDTLVGLESAIVAMTQKRLAGEARSVLADVGKCDAIEKDLVRELNRMARTGKIVSATLAELTEDAVRAQKSGARLPESPAPAPAPAPAASAPSAAAPAPPARKTLPRAGEKCAIHPNGCAASEGSPT